MQIMAEAVWPPCSKGVLLILKMGLIAKGVNYKDIYSILIFSSKIMCKKTLPNIVDCF